MFILSWIPSCLEFWSVNQSSKYENSQSKVLQNVKLFGEITNN